MLDELYGEAAAMIHHFKKTRYIDDPNLVGDVVSAILRAEHDYKEGQNCKLSTFRFVYAKNAIKHYLRDLYDIKKKVFNRRMKSLEKKVGRRGNQGAYSTDVLLKDILDRPIKQLDFDEQKLWQYIDRIDISERNRQLIKEFYSMGYTHDEIAVKFGISRSRVGQMLNVALKKIRAIAKKEEVYLC